MVMSCLPCQMTCSLGPGRCTFREVRLVGNLEARPRAGVAGDVQGPAPARTRAGGTQPPSLGRLHSGQEGDPVGVTLSYPRHDGGGSRLLPRRPVHPEETVDLRFDAAPEQRLLIKDGRV